MSHSRTFTNGIYDKFMGWKEYFYLKDENETLSSENARLRNLIENYTQNKADNFATPDSNSRINYYYIPARVVNNSVNKQYNYVIVDKGKLQGIYPDMAVISDNAVVGIVNAVSDNFSSVIPIINRNFRLSAKIKMNNYFGIIEWE